MQPGSGASIIAHSPSTHLRHSPGPSPSPREEVGQLSRCGNRRICPGATGKMDPPQRRAGTGHGGPGQPADQGSGFLEWGDKYSGASDGGMLPPGSWSSALLPRPAHTQTHQLYVVSEALWGPQFLRSPGTRASARQNRGVYGFVVAPTGTYRRESCRGIQGGTPRSRYAICLAHKQLGFH